MNICRPLSRWVISLAVSAALVLAPVQPMPVSAAGEAEHATHESIGAVGTVKTDAHALHTQHAEHSKAAGAKTSSCDQHDQCSKKCCAACAHCFTAAFTQSPAFLLTNTLQFPTVSRLHDGLTVAPHLRPPAA